MAIPFYAIRLADGLVPGVSINACCGKCGRDVPVDVAMLVRRFGPDERLKWLEAKLRCTACETKPGRFRVEWPPPGSPWTAPRNPGEPSLT